MGIDPVLRHCLTSALALADHGRRDLGADEGRICWSCGSICTNSSSCNGVSWNEHLTLCFVQFWLHNMYISRWPFLVFEVYLPLGITLVASDVSSFTEPGGLWLAASTNIESFKSNTPSQTAHPRFCMASHGQPSLTTKSQGNTYLRLFPDLA